MAPILWFMQSVMHDPRVSSATDHGLIVVPFGLSWPWLACPKTSQDLAFCALRQLQVLSPSLPKNPNLQRDPENFLWAFGPLVVGLGDSRYRPMAWLRRTSGRRRCCWRAQATCRVVGALGILVVLSSQSDLGYSARSDYIHSCSKLGKCSAVHDREVIETGVE